MCIRVKHVLVSGFFHYSRYIIELPNLRKSQHMAWHLQVAV